VQPLDLFVIFAPRVEPLLSLQSERNKPGLVHFVKWTGSLGLRDAPKRLLNRFPEIR
jgi:hypothetical protein